MTRAIILAAGQGTRLRPHTDDKPKCLVELCGRPLLHYQVETLQAAGVRDICVVTGYRADRIEADKDRLGYVTAHNPDYARTNMVASLMCAKDHMQGDVDVLVAYSDIVYRREIVDALLACPRPFATTVDLEWRALWSLRQEDPIEDAETLKFAGDGSIRELGKKPRSLADIEAQYMGLIKLAAGFAPSFVRGYTELDPRGPYDGKDRDNMYMTSYLQRRIDGGDALQGVPVRGGWLEVDTTEDLALYHRLREQGELAAIWSHG
ncbi:MAG: phosphocholine cytidylyltransferase family protein [Myxococcales bacterium]|nr:phosphocholine cytidylyltransferase family protein [Myxococcales bacterium]MCB9749262.1 phosphocholine cytidylyltransferase family protein [Myxococcales bacterium]